MPKGVHILPVQRRTAEQEMVGRCVAALYALWRSEGETTSHEDVTAVIEASGLLAEVERLREALVQTSKQTGVQHGVPDNMRSTALVTGLEAVLGPIDTEEDAAAAIEAVCRALGYRPDGSRIVGALVNGRSGGRPRLPKVKRSYQGEGGLIVEFEDDIQHEDPLRLAERAIVRGLRDAGLGSQSQVTHADRFEIATDDVIVRVERNPDAEYLRRLGERTNA